MVIILLLLFSLFAETGKKNYVGLDSFYESNDSRLFIVTC